ncbi:TetR/AcrR family transcriptional regulator [Myceligenerans pegani]|uniref:TetR family transcriptional regulator n=1 Tax=Myceligenerans pegani TaxID=2776917 RepID=A0ABR9N558_9MICO|nr:TetR/AcrR family transcriptional regulator [Myceligenerans sp. TRM 65318]MBE1878316.1 TetR family transcriptional regulator [Myceligenerans sp. TRM 65318]MBE3020587.1 TetR family transcriptional regulator [Myceligenerans sp. TRM 65318]
MRRDDQQVTQGADGVTKTLSAKGEARRQRIVDAATRLVARNGSRGTNLAEIAAAAGVSQSGLLYHYPSKEALLNAVLDRRDEAEDGVLWHDADVGLGILDVIADNVTRWADHSHAVGMHTVLVVENLGEDGVLHPRLTSRYHVTADRLRAVLATAQDRGEIRDDVEPHLKAIEIIAFVNGLETAWLLDPELPVAATAKAWAAQQRRALAT